MDIGHDYFEDTRFNRETFRFRCFPIVNSDTLPHWHNHLEMVLSTRNTNDVHVNGFVHVLDRGDVLVIPPGSLHSIRVRNSDYTAFVIGDVLLSSLTYDPHMASLIRPFLSVQAFAPLHLTAAVSVSTGVIGFLGQLLLEEERKDPGYEAAIKAILCLLFSALVREYPELSQWKERYHEGATQTMKVALVHLATHYHEKVTLMDMSRLSSMSVQHFCRLFKAHTGKSFLTYLTLLRLEHAHRLLMETGIPITRIPERTGFCNSNYFSRVFRAQYGVTPSELRRQRTSAS